ncbi:cytochrome oxidase complex biogenesis factor transmembrane protein [Herbaspirillum rubrisubalbicans]|uniref:SURF1-like protein n=1 Tax=Herbaspirillum rubrisubalbicans TaxID=80842 RepID=A0ABX9C5J8_9BURK|nr:SURF1 family protein [Herbaspirillum rubrisubalbicans]RAM65678.1 cytochrome oxidase complex biogenesis factor transmembrane protein [Herbaspirillum rubrisubalbicans]RAN43839.1 cytochrome oxidase complex biogenesis factor transmembrane protein [Herbaspirillum rubrisubalbicans]
MPTRFIFRIIPFCATVIVAAAGIALGQWQTHRAEEKQALQQRLQMRASEAPLSSLPAADAADVEFARIKLRGQFVPQWTLYLENRPYQGSVGFYVLTLFQPEGSAQAVMVARGWAPRDALDRTRVPQVAPPAGVVEVEGVLRRDAGHVLQLGQADAPRPQAILQNLDIPALAQASGVALSPFVIEQGGAAGDTLVRDWPAPALGIDRHRGYAVQWYALAAMALIFFLVTGFKRGRHDKA